MGIERFYGTIVNSNVSEGKAIIKNLLESVAIDNLYIDFNSIVYRVAEKIERELNTLLFHAITNAIDEQDILTVGKYNIDYDKTVDNREAVIAQIKDIDTSQVAIDEVESFIDQLCTTIADPQELKKVYISIDGMPNMGKIWEQKRRRYSTSVMSKLRKIIYEEFKDKGELSTDRVKFETNMFMFDRSLIGPNSPLMDGIVERMMSPAFTENLRGAIPNLTEIAVNHHNIPGEGEKKIMEYIIANKEKCRHCIYSPDSDVTILSIILRNILEQHESSKGSQFFVLRIDQQKNQYNFIDVEKVIVNILGFMKGSLDEEKVNKRVIDIINDVCFIITLFGNDFVPKIQTINISVHIDLLLEKYSTTLKKLNSKHNEYVRFLVNRHMDTGKDYTLNWVFFMEFVEQLKGVEHYLYGDLYIEKRYNYRWFKRYMTKLTMTETLYDYVDLINKKIFPAVFAYNQPENADNKSDLLNKLMVQIYGHFGVKNTEKVIDLLEKTDAASLEAEMIKQKLEGERVFINKAEIFMKFFMSAHKFDRTKPRFADIPSNNKVKSMLKFVLDNFDFNIRHRLMKGRLFKNDISDPYHVRMMEEDMAVEGMTVTDYDKELYRLERRMDPYDVMLNDVPNNYHLGRIRVKYIKRKNIPKYEIEQQKTKSNYEMYAKDYMKIDPKDTTKLLDVTKEYVMGLYWVMDFYINKNNREQNLKDVSVWFYPHYYAPTLYMISSYNKSVFSAVTSNVKDAKKRFGTYGRFMTDQCVKMVTPSNKKYFVKREDFMNKEEHYMYVNPVSGKDEIKIDNMYTDVRADRDLFPDIRGLAKDMYDNKTKFMGYMDCVTAMYNSKCKMDDKLMPAVSFHDYMEKIKKSTGKKRISPTLDGMEDAVAYI